MLPVAPEVLGGFILTAGAIVLSPGPDTVIILRYSISSGRRIGLATVLGVQLGLIVHTLLAVFGISLIIATTPLLLKAVAMLGAVYLVWLGAQSLRKTGPLSIGATGQKPVSANKAMRDAIFCNLLNPKVILLFLALFPNFIDYGRGDTSAQLWFLALVLIIINVIWQAPIALAAEAVQRWLKNPKAQRGLSVGTGLVLMGFAVLMIIEHLL